MHEFLQGLLKIRDVDQLWLLIALIGVDVGLTWIFRKKYYSATDSLCSIFTSVTYGAVVALSAGTVLLALYWFRQFAYFDVDWTSSIALIVAAYVIVDFVYYWYHRAVHEIRVGWGAHVVHHSSQYFNVGTALRSSFVEAWTEPLMLIPIVLLGIDPIMAIALMSLNHLYQYGLHTQHIGKLGPLEWILNTPSHHRVHHGSNIQYCDKNYGGTFIVWDRIFGTFEKEVETPVYGIRHQLADHNVIRATFHEYAAMARDLKQAKSLREVLGVLFAAPGWKADGTGETTRQMQARAKAEEDASGAPVAL